MNFFVRIYVLLGKLTYKNVKAYILPISVSITNQDKVSILPVSITNQNNSNIVLLTTNFFNDLYNDCIYHLLNDISSDFFDLSLNYCMIMEFLIIL